MMLVGILFTVFVTIPAVTVVSVLLVMERAAEQEEADDKKRGEK